MEAVAPGLCRDCRLKRLTAEDAETRMIQDGALLTRRDPSEILGALRGRGGECV
jgi:hypothetical protein